MTFGADLRVFGGFLCTFQALRNLGKISFFKRLFFLRQRWGGGWIGLPRRAGGVSEGISRAGAMRAFLLLQVATGLPPRNQHGTSSCPFLLFIFKVIGTACG